MKLALIAPLWVVDEIRLDSGVALGAYRKVSVTAFKDRWLAAAPEAGRATLIPRGWFELWAKIALATDQKGNAEDPPVIRVVNGPLLDVREYWAAGKALYDPGDIRVPVLVTHGDWDGDMPITSIQNLFLSLKGTPYRCWVEIGEGTHMIILEKNRLQVFDAIHQFLAEEARP